MQSRFAMCEVQFLDQLAHALRCRDDPKLTPAGIVLLNRVVMDRYELCHELGLGVEAATLVFKHRFEVAR